MTVPGGPTVAVRQANAVAALLALDRRPARVVDAHVRHAVTQRVDHARRRRPHLDAGRHRRQIADRDVGALVPVAAQAAAHVVAHTGTGIVIDVAQRPAVGARAAVDRQGQIVGRHGGGRHGGEQKQNEGGGSGHGSPSRASKRSHVPAGEHLEPPREQQRSRRQADAQTPQQAGEAQAPTVRE